MGQAPCTLAGNFPNDPGGHIQLRLMFDGPGAVSLSAVRYRAFHCERGCSSWCVFGVNSYREMQSQLGLSQNGGQKALAFLAPEDVVS